MKTWLKKNRYCYKSSPVAWKFWPLRMLVNSNSAKADWQILYTSKTSLQCTNIYLQNCFEHAQQLSEDACSFQRSWKDSCQTYKELEIVSVVPELYKKPFVAGSLRMKQRTDPNSWEDAEAGQPYSSHLLHWQPPHCQHRWAHQTTLQMALHIRSIVVMF